MNNTIFELIRVKIFIGIVFCFSLIVNVNASSPKQPKTSNTKSSDFETIQQLIRKSLDNNLIIYLPSEPIVEDNPDINKAIRNGDAIELSSFFNTSIEIVLPNDEGTYSKVQAQMILSLFFEKNPGKSFFVKQEGSSPNNTQFVIGTYQTLNNRSFRVYYVTKKVGNRDLIQHLEFELK
jgi:hypothetical protein